MENTTLCQTWLPPISCHLSLFTIQTHRQLTHKTLDAAIRHLYRSWPREPATDTRVGTLLDEPKPRSPSYNGLVIFCVSCSVVVRSLAKGAQQRGVVSSRVGRLLVRKGFMNLTSNCDQMRKSQAFSYLLELLLVPSTGPSPPSSVPGPLPSSMLL